MHYSHLAGGDIMKWTFITIGKVYYWETREAEIGWRISVDGGTNIKDGINFGCTTWKNVHAQLILPYQT